MRKTHLEILVQGVTTWNHWRREHPKTQPELVGANLRGQDLSGVDLHGADLRDANLCKAYLSKADLSEANLRDADLGETNLSEAKLTKAYLYKVQLNAANLNKADLSGAELFGANISEADLRDAKLNAAFLSRAALRGANLNRADLSRANLRTADCTSANFNSANLNHAQLTGAVLCDIQRAGWSVVAVLCEYAFWAPNGRQRLNYAPGEFERLYANRTRIVLLYPDGLSAREFATLPLLIQALQRELPEHPLLLRNLEEDAGGATLTLEFEDESRIAPENRQPLKATCEERGRELIAQQRETLGIPGQRVVVDTHLEGLQETLFPQDEDPVKTEEEKPAPTAPAVRELPPSFADPSAPISVFLDLDTHSSEEAQPPDQSGQPHDLTDELLQAVPHSYSPDGGESAVIGFDSPLEGIHFAVAYLKSLETRQHQTPQVPQVPEEGPALVSYHELTEGPQGAAPSGTQIGEVLISAALRHHPGVALDQELTFVPVERKVKQAFGDKQAGDTIQCFLVKV